MTDPLSNAGVPIPLPRGDDELASSSTLSSHGSTDNSRVYHFVTSFLNPHSNANANPAAAASGPRVNQQQQLPRQASRSPSPLPLPWPLPRPPPRPRSVESETTPLMGSAATRTNARHSGTYNERPGAGAAKERSSHSSTERQTENPRFVFWVGIALLVLFASVLATYQHNNQEQDVSSTWTNDKNEDLLLYRHAGIDNGRTGSSTPSKYKKVRYFGFQIYTGAAPAFLNHRNNDSNNDSNSNNNDSNNNDSNINNSNNDSNDGARTVKAKAQRVPNPECIRSGEIHTGDHRARNANHTYGQVPLEDGSTGLQCYVGHEDPKTDVRERLRILRDAVEQAYEEYQSLLGAGADDGADDKDKNKDKDKADDGARNEPDVLKIFAAPEFFFRGLSGAYDFSEDPRRLDRIFGFNHTTSSSSSSSSAAGNPDSDDDGTNKDDDDQFCSEDSPVCAVLVGLQEMVEDERFEDWLFLFGTVVATQTIPVEKDPTKDGTASEETTHSHDGNYEYLYYNFAPVYKGFDPKKLYHPPRKSEQQQQHQHQQHFALGKRFLVPKRYVSTIDFLTPTRDIEWRDRGSEWEELFGPDNDNDNDNDNNDESSSSALDADSRSKIHHPSTKAVDNPRTYLHKRYDDDWFAAYKNRLYDRAGYVQVEYDWLVVDDIAFTIEVCLDHELRTALDAYNGDVVTGKTTRIPATSSSDGILRYVPIPNQQAQIGLVASAGMSPNTESLALAQNGILLLQDGLSNQTARRFVDYELREQCGSQQEVQFEGGTVAVRRRAKVSKTEVRFEYDLLSSSSSNSNGNGNNMDDDPNHCGTTSGGMMTADDEEVVACEHKVPVYDGKTATPDDVDDPTKGASVEYWKTKLRGIFSTEMYEPHLVLYGPFDIPQADI